MTGLTPRSITSYIIYIISSINYYTRVFSVHISSNAGNVLFVTRLCLACAFLLDGILVRSPCTVPLYVVLAPLAAREKLHVTTIPLAESAMNCKQNLLNR